MSIPFCHLPQEPAPCRKTPSKAGLHDSRKVYWPPRDSLLCFMFAGMTYIHCPLIFRDWTCGRDLTQQSPLALKSYDLMWLRSTVHRLSKSRISLCPQMPMTDETGPAEIFRVKPPALNHAWVLSALQCNPVTSHQLFGKL